MAGVNEWATVEHARAYLERADRVVNRDQGEAMVRDLVPVDAARILDLGTGDGRLLTMLKADRPAMRGVGLDFNPVMVEAARAQFAPEPMIELIEHDLSEPLPDLGQFDAIVSSFVIHHFEDRRKRKIYAEVFARLRPGGVFCNLEHVEPPSKRIHHRWLEAMGRTPEDEDPSNQLTPVETQLRWLREIGFEDVDCFWKWYELAVLAGWKPLAT